MKIDYFKLGAAIGGTILFIWIGSLFSAAPCPAVGDSPNKKLQAADILKNRSVPGNETVEISLDKVLASGDDTNRFSNDTFVSIKGYVVLVKDGGPETCNCHATDEMHLDTHIEIAADPGETDTSKVMIVEVTPTFKAKHPDWTTAKLRKALMNRAITFTGWLFFDTIHKGNAYNTSPTETHIWRATCWEVHPVEAIDIIR